MEHAMTSPISTDATATIIFGFIGSFIALFGIWCSARTLARHSRRSKIVCFVPQPLLKLTLIDTFELDAATVLLRDTENIFSDPETAAGRRGEETRSHD